MIFLAISSLMATRASLTLTITFPPSDDTMRHRAPGHKAEIFEMLFDLSTPADFEDQYFLLRHSPV